MTAIDERLLEPNGEPELSENFNRVLELLDQASGQPGPEGPKGDPGVGVKTITGSIDGANKLTLVFTMTDDSQQTVEGNITPPVTV